MSLESAEIVRPVAGTHGQGVTIRNALLLFFVVVAIALLVLALLKPIPQDPAYHHFADRRELLGIPNALNVLSNLPFLLVAILGFRVVLHAAPSPQGSFVLPQEKYPYLALFAGVALVAFGSGYYHLRPDNATLVWDRIPMAVGFMGLFAAVLGERLGLKWGLRLLPILVILGAASVWYWYYGELHGRGDLRPYIGVQFLPLLLIPLLIVLFPSRYTAGGKLLGTFTFYILAKILETFDAAIYQRTVLVSGHTLKHCAAALAIFFIVQMLNVRRSTS